MSSLANGSVLPDCIAQTTLVAQSHMLRRENRRVLSLTVDRLLDELARETPVPGAGPAAALVAAAAASLAAMGARASYGSWDEASAAVAQAELLRARAAVLAQEDARAVEAYLAARRPTEAHQESRDFRVGQTLERAADVPLAIAETATDAALLAAHVADRCQGEVRADAAAAALLAHGAARAAAHLVEINLVASADDERVKRARDLVRTAGVAANAATAATGA